ncbi:MAG: hypothetical protein LBL82_07585 [Oscillospiraceae bacterium]|jgi:hypothetical protein|nr:hypothetical protein [Oscillospiraceae bacterium]
MSNTTSKTLREALAEKYGGTYDIVSSEEIYFPPICPEFGSIRIFGNIDNELDLSGRDEYYVLYSEKTHEHIDTGSELIETLDEIFEDRIFYVKSWCFGGFHSRQKCDTILKHHRKLKCYSWHGRYTLN